MNQNCDFQDFQTHRKQQSDYKENSSFNTENLISFEKVFKQQAKENQQHQQIENTFQESGKCGFNRSHSPLPGIIDIRSKMNKLTQQQAAKTIQRAFRIYLAKQQNKLSLKYNQSIRNDLGNKSNYQKYSNDHKLRQAALINSKHVSSTEIGNGNNDDYNFINVFKKRGSNSITGISSVQTQSRLKFSKLSSYHEKKNNEDDYCEDLTMTIKKKEVNC